MEDFVTEKMFENYSEFSKWTNEFPTVTARTDCPFCSSVKNHRDGIYTNCKCDEEGNEEDRMMVLHIEHARMTGEELDALGNRLGKVYRLYAWQEPEEIKQDLSIYMRENRYATIGVYDQRDLCGLLQGVSALRQAHALVHMYEQGPRNREPQEMTVSAEYMIKDFIPSDFDIGDHVLDIEMRIEDTETVVDDHYDYVTQPVFSIDMPLCRWTRRPIMLTTKEVENLLDLAQAEYEGYATENTHIS